MHVETIAHSLDVPTMLYNIPQMVKTVIEPETVSRLANSQEIIGIKDSSGDMIRFQQFLRIQNAHQSFSVYQGAEALAALSIMRGARGAVLGLANVAPQLCVDLFQAARSGNVEEAWALQERLMALWKLYTHGQWLPCLKAAVTQLGICQPHATAPFQPLSDDQISRIMQHMEDTGVLS